MMIEVYVVDGERVTVNREAGTARMGDLIGAFVEERNPDGTVQTRAAIFEDADGNEWGVGLIGEEE